MVNAKLTVKRGDNNVETTIVDEQNLTHDIPLTMTRTIDGQSVDWFKGTIRGSGTPPPPPPMNIPPIVTLITTSPINVAQHTDVTMQANITDPDGTLEDVSWPSKSTPDGMPVTVTEANQGDVYSGTFHAHLVGQYAFEVQAMDNQHSRTTKQIIVNVGQTPPPPPPPPTGEELYNSHTHSKLHDGKKRIMKSEGSLAPNGLGVECRASGNPRLQVNEDNTFSLLCDAGHGRLYFYVINYNAKLEVEWAFWKTGSGQDNSMKMRSRHNESGPSCSGGAPISPNRFGGYGWAVKQSGWNAKREPTHNCHDESKSGSSPSIGAQQYVKTVFTVKDEGSKVRQLGTFNGNQVMDKTDDSPKPFMVDAALYAQQSYLWIRQNITSGTGELRIKSLRVLKA